MGEPGLAYKVEDRSLLLPLYKRFLVDPLLPFIPARIHPNSITHAGHVINLIAAATVVCIGASSGWSFLVAAIGVQIYNWCDNADGGHARRTKQCSALGELLDHGLDVLNVTYIAYMSAVSIGAPPMWWVGMALVLTSAGGFTYWEQSETGTFHLGRLNQIEGIFVLSTLLAISAAFGTGIYEKLAIGPLTLRMALMLWVLSTTVFGSLHCMWRVYRKRGARALAPVLPFIAFLVGMSVATLTGSMAPLAAVIVGSIGNAFFAMRMLTLRLRGERPRFEFGLAFGAVALGVLVVWRMVGRPVGLVSDATYVTLAAIVFGGAALINAREGVKRVVLLDAAARS